VYYEIHLAFGHVTVRPELLISAVGESDV